VLTLLARDDDVGVRKLVASHKKASHDALTFLAKDEDFWVRLKVAENENTPPEIRDALASDDDAAVRCRVAGSTQTLEVLALLAQDKNKDVRRRVARSKHTPPELSVELARHVKSLPWPCWPAPLMAGSSMIGLWWICYLEGKGWISSHPSPMRGASEIFDPLNRAQDA
jgi:hypothetical protein